MLILVSLPVLWEFLLSIFPFRLIVMFVLYQFFLFVLLLTPIVHPGFSTLLSSSMFYLSFSSIKISVIKGNINCLEIQKNNKTS